MRLTRLLIIGICLALFPVTLRAAPPQQAQDNRPLCFFQIVTDDWRGGYYVCDDAQAQLRTAFSRQPFNLGWPLSQRYLSQTYPTQAFEKGILQWRGNGAVLLNIFDDLHNAGLDPELLLIRQVPPQLPAGWDSTSDFAEIVRKRQALLNARPALRRAYFSVRDPLSIYGLPTSEVTDMGNHFAIRLQRGVLQEWKENVPWARAGEVTAANAGAIAREFGLVPYTAVAYQQTPYIPNVPGAPSVPGIPPAGPSVGVIVPVTLPGSGPLATPIVVLPTSTPVGGVPTATPVAGIPTATPIGIVPTPTTGVIATATPVVVATVTLVPPTATTVVVPTVTTTPPVCDSSYPTICLPPPPPDLNCPDIPYRNFPVTGADPHRLDNDNDGIGCET